MIRVMFKPFLLITLTLAIGFVTFTHAQQSTPVLSGEWVGNIDSPGRIELARFSLTENAGEMRSPLRSKFTLVQIEGSRVRLEISSIKLVMTGTIAGDKI